MPFVLAPQDGGPSLKLTVVERFAFSVEDASTDYAQESRAEASDGIIRGRWALTLEFLFSAREVQSYSVEKLAALRGKVLDLVAPRGVWKDVAIVSLAGEQTAEHYYDQPITLGLKTMLIAESLTLQQQARAQKPVGTTKGAPQDNGRVTPTPAAPQVEEQTSVLYDLLGS